MMSDKKLNESLTNNPEKDEAKILYGVNNLVCFACGEKIKDSTKVCPYCNTSIK